MIDEEPSGPTQEPRAWRWSKRVPRRLFPWGVLLAIPILLGIAALPWCAR